MNFPWRESIYVNRYFIIGIDNVYIKLMVWFLLVVIKEGSVVLLHIMVLIIYNIYFLDEFFLYY